MCTYVEIVAEEKHSTWKDENVKERFIARENAGLRKLGQNKSLISIEKIVFPSLGRLFSLTKYVVMEGVEH